MTKTVLDLGRVIRRGALLERLLRIRPEIVALVAPAGFGKSTLALQFTEGAERVAICDCAGVVDELDLARRLIFSLSDEDPERGATLSQRELLLGDGTMSAPDRVNLAVAAWREPSKLATFVFENVEHLVHAPLALEVLQRFLRERPPQRTVIVCSRENLRMHLTRFAAPHRIVTFRAEDLAFSRAEVDEVFAPLALAEPVLERIFTISQGWPVPVLFLARLASEGRHDAILERLGVVAFEELYEYLADQVIAALPASIADALFAAACIERATARDIVLATGKESAPQALIDFARSSPFVRVPDDLTFVVHPLMSAMLVESQGIRRDELLAKTAERYEAAGDGLRATELQLARRDQEAAARSLEQVPVGDYRAPSMRYSRALSSLDRSLVRRYPTLWSCSALLQTFTIESEQLLEEAGILWASLPAGTPLQIRYYVLATKALLLTYLGRFAEALEVIETAAPRASIPETPVMREHGYAVYLRGTVLGRQGRVDEAERELELAWPLVSSMDAMASAALVIRATEIERVRGQAAKERELLGRSLDYARSAELSNFECFRLAELVLSCWLQGDDYEYNRFVDELERIADRDGVRGFRFFLSCLRDRNSEPVGADLLRWVIFGRLLRAGNSPDRVAALAFATAAREDVKRYPSPYVRSLVAMACAELSSGPERDRAYADATAFAAQCGSQPFIEAVAEGIAGTEKPTMLAEFLRRFRRSKPNRAHPRFHVSVLTGEVKMHGVPVKLGGRELELIFALARRRRASSREELVDALWPGRDGEGSANSLKVYIHRVRQHLGDDGIIERDRDGVRLCQDAVVDLWDIERDAADLRSRETMSDADLTSMRAIYERLCVERPRRFAEWEWFARVERFLQELRCEFGIRLARSAIARGDLELALQLADGMIAFDGCHEGAHEVAILAHLAEGNRAAAMLRFRKYRDILSAELDCEPSPAILKLVQA